MADKDKKGLLKRLRSRYFFVIRKEENFEEKLSFRSSLSGFIMIGGGLAVLLIILVISLIAFTPIREYIPGYEDINVRKNLIYLSMKTDSLNKALSAQYEYMNSIRRILSDSDERDSATLAQLPDTNLKKQHVSISSPSHADTILRNEIESQNSYNIGLSSNRENEENSINSYFFFTPLKGLITNGFNPSANHYGIDIVSKENEAVKATLDGTVILSTWTLATGNVIILQHQNNLISVYEHNSVLLKKTADNVQAGDVIAIVGNTGELTTGPHLHFELWYKGVAVNPVDYIAF